MHLTLNTDGGSRNNPGKAGIGFVIKENVTVLYQGKKYIGIATNNEAEYTALIEGLKYINLEYKNTAELTIFCDSELMVKQVLGIYKIKQEHLQKLCSAVKAELSKLKRWELIHVLREKNKEADKLVNEALDEN